MDPETEELIHAVVYDGEPIRVVADIAGGVSKDAIDLRCDGEEVTIEVRSGLTGGRSQVSLPRRVDEQRAKASYNNGVLEVAFD